MLVSSSDGFWREALFAAILLSALAMVAVVVVESRCSREISKKFWELVVCIRLASGSEQRWLHQ
jgi:hypothetical protein